MEQFILEILGKPELGNNDKSRKVISAILAAGSSERFGSSKQLAQLGQQNLIQHVQKILAETTDEKKCVILGCRASQIKDFILSEFEILENENWKDGLASSIHVATKFAKEEHASHLLLLVCDQPFVSTKLLKALWLLSEQNPKSIIACKYKDTSGIPAIFPAHSFDALEQLSGDKGAKGIIQQNPESVFLDFADGDIDIDTPEDLQTAVTSKRFD